MNRNVERALAESRAEVERLAEALSELVDRWRHAKPGLSAQGCANELERALAASAKGVGRQSEDDADEDREPCPGCFVRDCNGECMENL